MGTTTIATLAINVISRIEEENPPIFWNLQTELYSALVEAMNDLLLLVGRPNLSVNQSFTLTPNTVWQTIPKGQFLITDVQGPASPLWRISLFDLDYLQASSDSSWENDIADYPQRWAPIGLNYFLIHPAVSQPTQVQLTTIAYPTTDTWPYSGNETVPFHDEFFVALEEYSTHILTLKEAGATFKDSMALYQGYLSLAQRMTELEDKRDPLIFSPSFGGRSGLNAIVKR